MRDMQVFISLMLALSIIISPACAIVWTPDGDRYTATIGDDILYMWNRTGVTMNWTPEAGVTSARVLDVAGGGAGGNDRGGGGGAGGLNESFNYSVTAGVPITVIVGKGGQYTTSTTSVGNDGSNSIFDDLNMHGGGGGANYTHVGRNGGSGGGGAYDSNAGGSAVTSPFREGYDGGQGASSPSNGGGGGGRNTTGSSGNAGGAGGTGYVSNITGEDVVYSQGGDGGGFFDTSGEANATGIGYGGHGGGYSGSPQHGWSGADGIIIVRYSTPKSLTANFTANVTSGLEPLPVAFTDTSTAVAATIDAWNWSFDDGTVSSLQNPTHIFLTNDTYTVNLTVTNISYSLESTKFTNITVGDNTLLSDFVANVTSAFNESCIQFTDLSIGNPTGWNWSFGDGFLSTDQNPTHCYSVVGNFSVALNVSRSAV